MENVKYKAQTEIKNKHNLNELGLKELALKAALSTVQRAAVRELLVFLREAGLF